jgi:hypothetical protein
MEQCVRVPEVLLEIFEHLERNKKGHNTLVSLARTSSTFHDGAAQILRKELPGLDVIRNLFPRDTFEIGVGLGEEGSLVRALHHIEFEEYILNCLT